MREPPDDRFETFDTNKWFVDDDDGYERAVGRWKGSLGAREGGFERTM